MGYAITKTCNKCGVEKHIDCFSVVRPGRGDKNNRASRCKECRSAANLAWYYKNLDAAKASRRSGYVRRMESEKLNARRWREQNKERHLLNNKRWKSENAPRNTMRQAKRVSAQKMATPSWLTAIDLAIMQEMYDIAAARNVQTAVSHHVDHIFPLKGENFSGLNVPWNLRVITASENTRKKNKFPVEYSHLAWGAC
jgi:hypothetical protein